MSELIIDLSGKKGLGKNFFGDSDVLTPQPNLRTVEDSEMAQGLFNPFLRKGYLAPVTTSSSTVTLTPSLSTVLGAVAHNHEFGETYFSNRDTLIYKLDTLSGVALNQVLSTATDTNLHDLCIYEINTERKLFYTYLSTESLLKASVSVASDWLSLGITIAPESTTTPKVIASATETRSASTITQTISIPDNSNMSAIVISSVVAATTTGVTFDGDSMTKYGDYSHRGNGNTWEESVWYISGITTGDVSVVMSQSSGNIASVSIIIFDETAIIPITEIDENTGITLNVENTLTYLPYSASLQYTRAHSARWTLAGMTANTSYNPSAQTSNQGYGLYLDPTGTIMYVTGYTGGHHGGIYQYTLSPAELVSSATYATKTFDTSTQTGAEATYDIRVNTAGTSFWVAGASNVIYQYTMGTAFDISTASYASISMDFSSDIPFLRGFDFSADGSKFFAIGVDSTYVYSYQIYEYDLSTPGDISTATLTNQRSCFDLVGTTTTVTGITLAKDDEIFFLNQQGVITKHYFNTAYPLDITHAVATTDTYTISNTFSVVTRPYGARLYARSTSNDDVLSYSHVTGSAPVVRTEQIKIESEDLSTSGWMLSKEPSQKRILEIGHAEMPVSENYENNWLTSVQDLFLKGGSDYNFMRVADNGFMYVFAKNVVHKIDGSITGGVNGVVTPNVLLFPNYFTITDAIDYRSKLYIAVHQNPIDQSTTSLNNFNGKSGIFIWNRISTQLNSSDYIELPGVREIKRIYASPDGVLKILVISDSGLTELRQFGYNDSGGVVFPVVKELGIGAYPQFPAGLTIAGDKTLWLANDGNLYAEKGGAIVQLFQANTPGTSSSGVANNISSGAVLYGSGTETASTGYRSNKQGVYLNYNTSMKKIYPFDLTNGSNAAQSPSQGDVYSGVYYIPVTSILRSVRVYNVPTSSSGSTVVGTVKLYFNQSSTASMTKTITMDEAKRGYVDFHINKPYINAIQVEIEWATGISLGSDTYLPSVAIVKHDPTTTKSPDNG